MENKIIINHKKEGTRKEIYVLKFSDEEGQNALIIKHGKGQGILVDNISIIKVPGEDNMLMVELVKAAS